MTFRVLHGRLYVRSCAPFCPSCTWLQSYCWEDSQVPIALPPHSPRMHGPILGPGKHFPPLLMWLPLPPPWAQASPPQGDSLWPIHHLELALLFSVCFLLGLFRACHRSTGDVERMHKGSLLEMILLPIMVSPRLSSVVQQNCTGSQRPDNKLSLATHSLWSWMGSQGPWLFHLYANGISTDDFQDLF